MTIDTTTQDVARDANDRIANLVAEIIRNEGLLSRRTRTLLGAIAHWAAETEPAPARVDPAPAKRRAAAASRTAALPGVG